jgi:repressor LexA
MPSNNSTPRTDRCAALGVRVKRSMTEQRFTARQGQYLAFIYYYEKINRRPPAEADIQRFFNVTPPSVHQMVLSLEAAGLISRTPGQARSIRVLVPVAELPQLE